MGAVSVSVYAVANSVDDKPVIPYNIVNAVYVMLNTCTLNLNFITQDENVAKFQNVHAYITKGDEIPRHDKSIMLVAFTRIFAFLQSDKYDRIYEVKKNGVEDTKTVAINLTETYGTYGGGVGVTLRDHLLNIFTLMRSLYNITTEEEDDEEDEREAKRRKTIEE